MVPALDAAVAQLGSLDELQEEPAVSPTEIPAGTVAERRAQIELAEDLHVFVSLPVDPLFQVGSERGGPVVFEEYPNNLARFEASPDDGRCVPGNSGHRVNLDRGQANPRPSLLYENSFDLVPQERCCRSIAQRSRNRVSISATHFSTRSCGR